MAGDCPECRRNAQLAAQIRGFADSMLVGGNAALGAFGVPGGLIAPAVVESAALALTGRGDRVKPALKRRGRNAWNKFLKDYVGDYRKRTPKGRKTFGTLSKEAARAWRRRNK